MLGSIAQYEREVIRLRLMAGRARKKLEGGYAGGGPPYGWAAVRGELVKVPASSSPSAHAHPPRGRAVLPADRRRA
jgi:DNA invertase Pin-like site-specific DNA recombinase